MSGFLAPKREPQLDTCESVNLPNSRVRRQVCHSIIAFGLPLGSLQKSVKDKAGGLSAIVILIFFFQEWLLSTDIAIEIPLGCTFILPFLPKNSKM